MAVTAGDVKPTSNLINVPIQPNTIYAVDIDGVLVEETGMLTDPQIPAWCDAAMQQPGSKVILVTARPADGVDFTKIELARWGIRYYVLVFSTNKGPGLSRVLNTVDPKWYDKSIIAIDDQVGNLLTYLMAFLRIETYWITKKVQYVNNKLMYNGQEVSTLPREACYQLQ